SVPNFVATGSGTSTPGLIANRDTRASETSLCLGYNAGTNTCAVGRLYAGAVNDNTTQSINLVLPGTSYGDRTNQLDLRLGKILRYARTRTQVSFDVYNVLNSSAVQSYNNGYTSTVIAWPKPTSILQARF